MIVYRLVKAKHEQQAFTGEGARASGGRWNSKGVPAVYASDSAALALAEVAVNLQSGTALRHYVLLHAELPDALVQYLPEDALPANWRDSIPPGSTQAVGNAFLAERRALALRVPSSVVPGFNFLVNPLHEAFARFRNMGRTPLQVDARLQQLERGA